MSEDPARDGDNWNSYCSYNPLRFVDPTGLYSDSPDVYYTNNPYYSLVSQINAALLAPVALAMDGAGKLGNTIFNIFTGNFNLDFQLSFGIFNNLFSLTLSTEVPHIQFNNGFMESSVTLNIPGMFESIDSGNENSELGIGINVPIYVIGGVPALNGNISAAITQSFYGEALISFAWTTSLGFSLLSITIGSNLGVDQNMGTFGTIANQQNESLNDITSDILSSINPNLATILGYYSTSTGDDESGDSSGDGSSGGGSIICVQLHNSSFLQNDIFIADEKFRDLLLEEDCYSLIGYQLWAKYVIKLMKRSDQFQEIVYSIAEPWIEYMAYEMGALDKKNRTGFIMMKLGLPICRLIGKVYLSLLENS